ncbi:hypothetical protein JYT74_03470, partial [Crocinitomix catalasitica]|nr:hypothetical protein [Crocinitomix catalasitica]
NALELSLGLTHVYGKRDYWADHYYDEWEDKYCEDFYDDCDYLGYRSSRPLGLQIHYLWHFNIPGVEGFSWYLGPGGQVAFQTVTYDYRYKPAGGGPWIYDGGSTYVDLDFGVDGVGGVEYTFAKAPFSVFADVTLFIEIYDSPGVFWFQGGIGGRYNF